MLDGSLRPRQGGCDEGAGNPEMLNDDGLRIALPEGLHPFVRLVLGDPAVQARLGAEIEANAFVAAAAAVAAEHRTVFDPAVLAAVLRPDPIGLGRFAAAPLECEGWPPAGWLPAQAVPGAGPPALDWLWFGERTLSASFYHDDVMRAAALPLNWLLRVRTGLPALLAGEVQADSLPPSGLIFHMSRCGSTLLAQMLAALPENVVLSEPEPLNEMLLWAWHEGLSPVESVPALRAVVAALGRRRGSGAQRLFIKTDAWHSLLLPHLHAAFPDLPWVYLFREPLEVLASHRRMPGIQIVAGTMPEELFGISGGMAMPPLDYTVMVLDAIGQAAIAHRGVGRGLFFDYPALIEAVPTRIAAHFGLALTGEQREAMIVRARRDAKAPDLDFTADGERKRAESTAPILEASAVLEETHRRLLELAAQSQV
jgi:hypothetical protein